MLRQTSATDDHPRHSRFRLRQRVFHRSEHLMRVAVERQPTCHVLRIPAIFLEAECAVGALENVDTMIACGVFERSQNLDGRGHSGNSSTLPRYPHTPTHPQALQKSQPSFLIIA